MLVPVTSNCRPAADAGTAARSPNAFATTHWSMIVRAADTGTAEGRAALEELCRIYWYPLYWFARRRGLAPQDAEDLTQGFLADLLARGAVAKADAAHGRFRTFLLASFKNFQSCQWTRVHAAKRGGGNVILSLEAMQAADGCFRDEPASTESPEKAYDRKWATIMIENTVATVFNEYAVVGKGQLFKELKAVLWGERGSASYVEIARRLGSTEGAIKVAAHRFRRRFREALRVEVGKTVMNIADLEDELRHLLAATSV